MGAAESKDELIANPRGIPYIAVRGRRGGSAMASARRQCPGGRARHQCLTRSTPPGSRSSASATRARSLTPEAQAIVWQAETLVIGERLDAVIDGSSLPDLKRILTWGAGFRETLSEILKLRGTPVTVLATGDPMHFGIGATLRRYVAAEEMFVLPSPSAFSLAAARLGWPLQSVTQISLHGRPLAVPQPACHAARPHPRPDFGCVDRAGRCRAARRAWLWRFVLHVLEHMGGTKERLLRMTALEMAETCPDISDFNTLAIDCAWDGPLLAPVPGLPDEAFAMTDNSQSARFARQRLLSSRLSECPSLGCRRGLRFDCD